MAGGDIEMIVRIKSGATATLRKKKGLRVSCCQSVTQPITELHPPKALHLPVSVVQLPQCFMAAQDVTISAEFRCDCDRRRV
jgi:hypothetical protein